MTVQSDLNEQLLAQTSETGNQDSGSSQFVAFTIGEQNYCVDIMSVREIRAWTGATPLPNTADYVRGVINLRGSIVPIVDLRTRFGQGETDPTKSHVVVIVAIEERLNGLLVDSVSDILTVSAENVAAIPETDVGSRARYLDGLITEEDRMVALIALDRVIDEISVQ
ncbi:MAG: chemotaxis protein CheW [Hyphomicrobiales bacterium]|nr:chemotaxis protein CheW [Hyphomicrobiales bacterium]